MVADCDGREESSSWIGKDTFGGGCGRVIGIEDSDPASPMGVLANPSEGVNTKPAPIPLPPVTAWAPPRL